MTRYRLAWGIVLVLGAVFSSTGVEAWRAARERPVPSARRTANPSLKTPRGVTKAVSSGKDAVTQVRATITLAQNSSLERTPAPANLSWVRRVVALTLWAVPLMYYIRGYPLTRRFVADLQKAQTDPTFNPPAPQWSNILAIPGGIQGVLNHINFGSPSMALYLAASFFIFPLRATQGLVANAGALLTIGGGAYLTASLFGAFQVLYGLYKAGTQGAALVFATTMILLTTLPFLQLISWQTEYAGRTLKDQPNQAFLPKWYLRLVAATNIMLPWFVGPLNQFFSLPFMPAGFNQSGKAVVQSIVDANYYATPKNLAEPSSKKFTPQSLQTLIAGLQVQVLYGSLAVIPMWAVLTNFGLFNVETPFSRCAFSKLFLEVVHKNNWAQLGIIGMTGLYWVLSFAWCLWGVGIYWAYGK